MNDISTYYKLASHIRDGVKIKPSPLDGYIPKPRKGVCKIVDGRITEITLSQSLIKSVFWTGPPTPHVGSWDVRTDACAWKFYNLNVTHKYEYPQSRSMMLGNFFETMAIGSGAYSKTLSVPANLRTGGKTVDEEHVLDAADRFKRVSKELGMIVGEGNTQVEFKTPVINPDHPDIKIYFKGVADLISPVFHQDINYDTCIVDIKLTKDRNIDFMNPYKPWESFCWGKPDAMSVLQGTSYSEGFQMPFVFLVFDFPKENPGWKLVPVRTLVTNPDDADVKLRHAEMKQGIRSFINTLVGWNDYGWPKSQSSGCVRCPVLDCEMKNQITAI